MEPLTALSLASSVIQFADFGSKLLSNSRKLYKSAQGSLSENVDIEVITTDLSTLAESLRRKSELYRLPNYAASGSTRSPEYDEALDRLCGRCVEIAEELMFRLKKLKVEPKQYKGKKSINSTERRKDGHDKQSISSTQSERTTCDKGGAATESHGGIRFGKWDSFRKALEASWNKKEIEGLATTLREFKGEIEFRILVSFRNSLNDLVFQQSQTFHQFTESSRLILSSFRSARDELANQLRIQAEKLAEIQESQNKGEIKESEKIQDIVQGKLRPVGMLQSPTGANDSTTKSLESCSRDADVEEEIRLLVIENSILGSLSFPTLTDRQESVEAAYQQTFEWIYEEADTSTKPWSNFVDWLRYGSGIYWVNGKAGSGKSTLMKYIYENNRTKEELAVWADSIPSEMSGFFFWNSGDNEQKSQRGLIRSLLFEILKRHRNLLPRVMPDIWEEWSTRATAIISSNLPLDSRFLPPEPKPWNMVQLKRVFRNLLQCLLPKVKLCLFIDGLDEYEGDYDDIVDLLQEHAKSPNIKLCLSSRPLLVFERSFSSYPSLKLQNLTYGDISHYVKDRLYSHKYMLQLSKQHATQVSVLIDEIVEKASGVFLWVKLVVRSLLHGLRDFNRISDLQRRVRHLPEDLESLYAHMLKHTDPFYYEQASQIFQIFRVARKYSPDKVTLLNLSWAEDEDETLAETTPIRPLTYDEIEMRCQVMDARLKSVCVGLLESNETQYSSIAPDAKVVFLHRTVSDWFAKPEVWNELLSRTAGKSFSPNLSMLRSCVLQIKCSKVSPALPLDMSIVSSALVYANGAETDLGCGFSNLLDQLDIAASYQWRVGAPTNFSKRETSDDDDYLSSSSENRNAVSISERRTPKPLSHELGASTMGISIPIQHGAISGSQKPGGYLHHWSYGIEIPGIKPLRRETTFYNLAHDIGLTHYVTIKYNSGIIADQDVNQHLLMRAFSSTEGVWSVHSQPPDPKLINTILKGGTDPNISHSGPTPWQRAVTAAALHFTSFENPPYAENYPADPEWQRRADTWVWILEIFIRHGADP
ncbi:small s protein, partial [Xylogone sp. PMI_703]